MSGRLSGKTALVTAAGQGIGRATALAFAREGAVVHASDIDEALLSRLSDDADGDLTTFTLDVRDGAAIRTAADRIRPDVLFNCAGFVHAGTILDAADEDLSFALDLNVASMFRTIRACLPHMLERGQGSIVNMASVVSSIVGAPNRAVYGTTKAAVIGLTKAVARDFVTQGIRCNAICPGTVDSPSLHDRLRATGDYEAATAEFVARQPMGRIAAPEEIASLAIYLASDEAAFTTGQACVVDGGWAG